MEIAIMQAIQSIAKAGTLWGDIVDNVMLGLSFFGETIVVILALFILYWCVDRKLGEYMLFCVFCSSALSFSLKNIFKRPRPFFSEAYANGEIRHVKVNNLLVNTDFKPTSFSFPSGHVTNGGTLYMGIASFIRRKWLTVLSIVFTVFLALSRVYLGVHYPTDTLAGFLIALGVTWGLGSLFIKFHKQRFIIAGIVTVLLAIVSIFWGNTKIFGLIGAGIGYCVCAPIEEKYVRFENTKVWWKAILRFLVGVGCAGLIFLIGFLIIPLEGIGVTALMIPVVGSAVLLTPYLFKVLKI